MIVREILQLCVRDVLLLCKSLIGNDAIGVVRIYTVHIVGSMEAPSKAFLLFFLLPDWLKLNHLKSRMECGFSDFFGAIFVPR